MNEIDKLRSWVKRLSLAIAIYVMLSFWLLWRLSASISELRVDTVSELKAFALHPDEYRQKWRDSEAIVQRVRDVMRKGVKDLKTVRRKYHPEEFLGDN